MADENINEAEISVPEDEGLSFTIMDDDGNLVECKVLYFFHAEHNNQNYMVYTTGNVNERGEEVSAVRYNPAELEAKINGEDVEVTLEPLTEEIEWAIVADTLKQLTPDGYDVDGSDVVSDDVALERTEDPQN